jgi:proton glutamate symport protein
VQGSIASKSSHIAFTVRVLAALVAGFALGVTSASAHSPWLTRFVTWIEPVGIVFVNAIRLAVIPLVVSSLIVGAASTGETRRISRTGTRAFVLVVIALFAATLFALAIAKPLLAYVNVRANAASTIAAASGASSTSVPSIAQWFTDLVPGNIFAAAANGTLLPLIVVAVSFGFALSTVRAEKREAVVRFFSGIADAFLALIAFVLRFAPIGVFALAVPLAARTGIGGFGALVFYIGILSAVSAAFVLFVIYPAAVAVGRVPLSRFATAILPAQAVAFTSRSSLAALPATYEAATTLGLSEEVSRFFLPVAAALFRVGGAMAQMVGVLFLAELYGVALTPVQLATVAVTVVATSLTVPGIPAGAIIVMMPVLAAANIPPAGIGVLLAVDTIPDMFRTLANVSGWVCVDCILGRWDSKPAAKAAAGTTSVPS